MKQYASVLLGLTLVLCIPTVVCCDTLGAGAASEVVKGVIALADSTQTSIVLPPEGGQLSIAFNTELSWEASSNAAWLTVSPSSGNASGSIKVTAEENASGSDRSAKVFITLGESDVSLTIKATQASLRDTPGPGPGPGPENPKDLEFETIVDGWVSDSDIEFVYKRSGDEGWTEYGKVSVAQPWWLGTDTNGNPVCESSVLLTRELDAHNVLCCIPALFADSTTEPSDMFFIWNTSTNWLDVDRFPLEYYYLPSVLGKAGQVFMADYYHYYSSLISYQGVWSSADAFYADNSGILRSSYSEGVFRFCGLFFTPGYGRYTCPTDDYIVTATLTK